MAECYHNFCDAAELNKTVAFADLGFLKKILQTMIDVVMDATDSQCPKSQREIFRMDHNIDASYLFQNKSGLSVYHLPTNNLGEPIISKIANRRGILQRGPIDTNPSNFIFLRPGFSYGNSFHPSPVQPNSNQGFRFPFHFPNLQDSSIFPETPQISNFNFPTQQPDFNSNKFSLYSNLNPYWGNNQNYFELNPQQSFPSRSNSDPFLSTLKTALNRGPILLDPYQVTIISNLLSPFYSLNTLNLGVQSPNYPFLYPQTLSPIINPSNFYL